MLVVLVKLNSYNSHKRTIFKTISWRFIGTIDTIIVAWFLTGSLSFGVGIGLVGLFTKTILYYLHERLWLKIN